MQTAAETRLVLTSQTGELKHELKGHSDFVKSLTIIQIPGTTPYLLTTSSDRTIRLWDLSPLQTDDGGSAPISALPLKEHTRPVDCAAWRVDESGHLAIWTADSMGIIKEWEIVGGKLKYVKDWKGHETSISCLHVTDDGLWSGKSLRH
jgi:WD40 repeat protein